VRQEIRLQGAGVHPQAQGHAPFPAGLHHELRFCRAPQVAGIDADGVGPRLQGRQGQAVIEVDIGDQGQGTVAFDLPEGPDRFLVGHGQAGHFTARRGQALDLGQGGRNIGGVGVGHALDHHRGAAADLHRSDKDGAGGSAPYGAGFFDLRHNWGRF
jgi:hypothetical protein